jgi:Rrf2 family protein
MDIIRRDTDYAFRIAACLTQGHSGVGTLSARLLSKDTKVPYPLTCKILQKLVKGGVAQSVMGPKGGFRLASQPQNIRFGQVIGAIQGPICVNKCLLGDFSCPLKQQCPAHPKLAELQNNIDNYLNELTLQEFVQKETCND